MSAIARSVVLALGSGIVALGVWLMISAQGAGHGAGWPPLVMGVLIVLSVIFEGRYRRANCAITPSGPDWQQTAETFRNDETGRMVKVWFNPATGERRYVEDAKP